MVDSTGQSRAWPIFPGFATLSALRNTRPSSHRSSRSDDEWLRNELDSRGRISSSPSISSVRRPNRNYQFDPNDRQYRCCCNSLSARRGSQLIGMFYVFASFFTFIYGCIQAANVATVSVCVPLAVIVAFAASLLLFAIHSDSPQLVIPFMTLQILGVIATAIFFVYSVFILSQSAQANRERSNDTKPQPVNPIIGAGVMTVIFLSVGLFVQVWFLLAVMSGYKLIRDKRRLQRIGIFEEGSNANAESSGVITTRQTETERLRVEYNLPPPPPAYSASDPHSQILSTANFASSRPRVTVSENRSGTLVPLHPHELGVGYAPPEGDAPPDYIEACNITSTSEFSSSASTNTRIQRRRNSSSIELERVHAKPLKTENNKQKTTETESRLALRSMSTTSEKSDSPTSSNELNNNNNSSNNNYIELSRSISESILETSSINSESETSSDNSSHLSDSNIDETPN